MVSLMEETIKGRRGCTPRCCWGDWLLLLGRAGKGRDSRLGTDTVRPILVSGGLGNSE